ncbi:MAG: hypothetical protein JEZ12_13135 [Desulfobacterium sp.]|nr:hypothetical protein [Desulfobacterium sp.]
MSPKSKPKAKKLQKFVQCRECGGIHFACTNDYNEKRPAHSGMIEMIPKYKAYGWQGPPQDPTAGYGVLECPACGSALAPAGKLKVVKSGPKK